MAAPAGDATSEWEARPLDATAPGGRWGIKHQPTGCWVAAGSEAHCRTLAAQLVESDAIVARIELELLVTAAWHCP